MIEKLGNKESETLHIAGVDYVFQQNPSFEEIGTKEQYIEYIKGIFPESEMKEVLYHGTNQGFESFDIEMLGTSTSNKTNSLGFYFVPDSKVASLFVKNQKLILGKGLTLPDDAKIYPVVVDIRNPIVISGDDFNSYAEKNEIPPSLKDQDRPVVIEPQIENIVPEFSVANYIVKNPESIHILGTEKDKSAFARHVSA